MQLNAFIYILLIFVMQKECSLRTNAAAENIQAGQKMSPSSNYFEKTTIPLLINKTHISPNKTMKSVIGKRDAFERRFKYNKSAMENISDEDLLYKFKQNMAELLEPHKIEIDETTNSPSRRARIIPEKLQYTTEITIKQGRLIGIIRNFQNSTSLYSVNQYLGIPYAEAPVGSRRFMPPGAPLPWQGLKIARHLPPVCPQRLPDISARNSAHMSPGRYEYLSRILPYLKNESEDCLYLNIYVPKTNNTQQQAYPVMVYIHGESFEWNSGNAYDGSVISSYGEVIFVTLNYRLGILGFMKPSVTENTVANFGLLDQIAALHWIKENIGFFGGDKDRVTLMGHNTGAACVNYLMISPVAKGLFNRAILMSGSAMSNWANSKHSSKLTIQIAKSLNCPLSDANEQMLLCLRQKTYQEVLKTQRPFSTFLTPITPIVDGFVVPNDPAKSMSIHSDNFRRYDLMFGFTESETYHAIGSIAIEQGFREDERDSILRSYMQNRFEIRPDLALAATLKKYSDMYTNPIKANNLEHRDLVLDVLSDANVVGPLVQTGLYHADINQRTFMYVFGHNSASGAHASIPYSVAGEELAFIFGSPLAPAGPFHNNYSPQEKLLSEAVISYWTNFAKSGNPKTPWKDSFINLHAMEWDHYDLDWPEYNKRVQPYINIGIPPSIGYKYRQIYTNFWNKELPEELSQIAVLQEQQQNAQFALKAITTPQENAMRSRPEIISGQISKYGSRDNINEDPVRTLKLLLQEPYGKSTKSETADNMYNAPPTFDIAKEDNLNTNTISTVRDIYTAGVYGVNGLEAIDAEPNSELNKETEQSKEIAKSQTTLHLLIALIVVFIIINVIIYSTFLFQRKKKAIGMKRKLGGILSYDGATDDELKRSKQTTQHDGDDSYIMDVVRKSNTYEIVKMECTQNDRRFGMTRQLSTSTVDTHTKVCEWMSNANLPRVECNKTEANSQKSSPFSSLFSSDSFKKQTDKVDVAIDATSLARGSSVLCQEPIEISKLKMDGRNIIICQEVEVQDQDLLTAENMVHCQHQHSHSDPLQMFYNSEDEQTTSFMQNDSQIMPDINVTSRSEDELKASLTPEHQLQVIKLRNYPKVLPTDSPIMTGYLSKSYKRNSLPPNTFATLNFTKNTRPLPPPRTVSTLDRNISMRRSSRPITTSPLMLAEDCTEEEEEPEITQNTLIVGPIIPKGKLEKAKKSTECITEQDTKYDLRPLNGVFQSFECKLNGDKNIIDCTTDAAHHTEKIYEINEKKNSIDDSTINNENKVETIGKNLIEQNKDCNCVKEEQIDSRFSSVSSTSSTLSSSSSSTNTVRTELKKP